MTEVITEDKRGSGKRNENYRNPLGNMTYKDVWDLKKLPEDKLEEFHKKFRISETSCPPLSLRPKNIICFHCKECFVESINAVKMKDVKKEQEVV